MGEAKERGTLDERIAKAKRLQELQGQLTPPPCPGCGLDYTDDEAMEEFQPGGFLFMPIQNMGIAHFGCPRCFSIMLNKEAFEFQTLMREKQAREKSNPVKVLDTGRTPGGLILPGRN